MGTRGLIGFIKLAALCLVMASCASRRPAFPDVKIRLQTNGSFFESSNGYLFTVLRDPKARLARIDVRYPVGASDDPEGKEGMAHLLEHLLYQHQIQRDGYTTTVFDESGKISSFFNAVTDEDYIHFEAQGLPHTISQLIQLEAERITGECDAITPEVFAREKEVVLNELRERLGPDGGDLRSEVRKALYPKGHRYHRVDSVATVNGITQADVCQFFKNEFNRGRASVVVSGNVTFRGVQEAVSKYFAKIPKRNPSANPKPTIVRGQKGKHRIEGDVSEGAFLLAWPLPPKNTKEYTILTRLGNNMAARLRQFAYVYGWGHSAETWVAGGGDAPFLILQVSLRDMEDVSEARSSAYKSVDYIFRRHGSKIGLGEAPFIDAYEPLSGRAKMYSDFLLYDGNLQKGLLGKLNALKKTKKEERQSIASKWLDSTLAKEIVIAPSPRSTGAQSVSSVFSTRHSIESGIVVNGEDADIPFPLPKSANLRIETTEHRTASGLKVVMWSGGQFPIVHSRLVVSSGAGHDPKGAEGLASMIGLDDAYQDSTIYWDRKLSNAVHHLIGRTTAELRFPGQSVDEKDRDHLRSRLQLRGVKESFLFEEKMREAVFGKGHPYARPSLTDKSISALTRDFVYSWARKHVVPKNSTLILAGQFEPELAVKWIDYYVDQLSSGEDSADLYSGSFPAKARWIAGKGVENSPMVEIDIRFRGGEGLDEFEPERRILRGILNSKLASLRSDKALSYGISAHYYPQKASGYWQISGSIDARRAAEAGKAIQEAIHSIRQGSQSYRPEFVLSRRSIANGFLASASNSAVIADRLEFIVRFSKGSHYFHKLLHSIANSSLQRVEALIREEFSPQQQITGAVGPAHAVAEFLAAAKNVAK